MTVEKIKNTSDARIISRKMEFEGFHDLETVEMQHKSFRHDGWSGTISREIFHAGACAVVLLYKPESDEILMNEQFRVAAFIAGAENPYLYECCAGMVDEGETPEAAVRREAKEETGSDIIDLEYIGHVYPSPGGVNETFHLYCGRINGGQHGGIFGMESESEEIRTHLLPAREVISMLDAGKITNAATALCLHWFARHKDRLQKKWGAA